MPGKEEMRMTPIPVGHPMKRSPQDVQGEREDINTASMTVGLRSQSLKAS